jgi:hypothetical protein
MNKRRTETPLKELWRRMPRQRTKKPKRPTAARPKENQSFNFAHELKVNGTLGR